MTARWPTHRVGGYLALVLVGLVGSLVAGRPEPVLLVAPFAVVLAVGIGLTSGATPPRVEAVMSAERTVEGEPVDLELQASQPPAGWSQDITVELPPELHRARASYGKDGGTVTVPLTPIRWGVHRVGRVAVRRRDPMRLFVTETHATPSATLRTYPSSARLRSVVEAADVQARAGNQRSRSRGDGIEFADLRPFTPGDRARSVNWRATARRGDLWVNVEHPERSADTILLLDTFGEKSAATRLESLDEAVRIVASLAAAYQARRDRVGLLTFGGRLRWLGPGLGERQLYRVVDSLLDTEALLTDAWQEAAKVPIGVIPPRALLLAVTPLQSDTSEDTLVDLRTRGFDVGVVMVRVPEGVPTTDEATLLARRLDLLERHTRRLRLERFGIGVGEVPPSGAVEQAVMEVELWRRRLPRVRA